MHPNSKTTSVAAPAPDLRIWLPRRPPRRLLNMCAIKSICCHKRAPHPHRGPDPAVEDERCRAPWWKGRVWEQITRCANILVERVHSEGWGGVRQTQKHRGRMFVFCVKQYVLKLSRGVCKMSSLAPAERAESGAIRGTNCRSCVK